MKKTAAIGPMQGKTQCAICPTWYVQVHAYEMNTKLNNAVTTATENSWT